MSYQSRFREFVERHPECLERASFEALARPATAERPALFLSHYVPIQPWPVFLEPRRFAELGRLSVEIFALVRSLPQRLFGDDATRLCDFYGLEPEAAPVLRRILDLPWGGGGESMRGDFILSDGAFKCLEINAGANAGGIFNFQVADACLAVPILRRFLAEEQLTARFRDPWKNLLQLAIERAMARGLHHRGSLNIAFAIPRPETFTETLSYIEPPYQALLAENAPGLEGRVLFCDYPQLRREGDELRLGQEPIHILLQHHGEVLITPVGIEIEAWLDGIIDLYSGPMAWIYKDKRNLALLSENLESGIFSREEAAVIERVVPWSRRLRRGPTTYRGERVELEKVLLSAQEDLVLKPAQGLGGVGVQVGRFTPREVWEALVAEALTEGTTYLAQEFVPSDLELHQWGERGSELCETNWGMFVAGDRFGGAYLRVCPPPEDGIINVTHGAEDGCALELIPAAEPCEPSAIDRIWPPTRADSTVR